MLSTPSPASPSSHPTPRRRRRLHRSRALLVLALVVGLGVVLGGLWGPAALDVARAQGPKPKAKRPAERDLRLPSLEIQSARGIVWVPLVAPKDGPIWLGLDRDGDRALQVIAEPAPEDRGVEVQFGLVEGLRRSEGPTTRPVAQMLLSIDDQAKAAEGLQSIVGESWNIGLGQSEPLADGCADCGVVRCCAARGSCISCGLCGQVCYEPDGRVEREGAAGEENEEGEGEGDDGEESEEG